MPHSLHAFLVGRPNRKCSAYNYDYLINVHVIFFGKKTPTTLRRRMPVGRKLFTETNSPDEYRTRRYTERRFLSKIVVRDRFYTLYVQFEKKPGLDDGDEDEDGKMNVSLVVEQRFKTFDVPNVYLLHRIKTSDELGFEPRNIIIIID